MRPFIGRMTLVPVLVMAAGSLLAGSAAAAQHSSVQAAGRLAGAPLKSYSSQASSYIFGGLTARRGPVVLDVTRNGRRIKRADGAIELQCSDGGSSLIVDSWRNVSINRRRSFRATAQDTGTTGDGGTVNASFSFAGKLNRRRTKVTGTWRIQLLVQSPDGSQRTCDSGALRFSARR